MSSQNTEVKATTLLIKTILIYTAIVLCPHLAFVSINFMMTPKVDKVLVCQGSYGKTYILNAKIASFDAHERSRCLLRGGEYLVGSNK